MPLNLIEEHHLAADLGSTSERHGLHSRYGGSGPGVYW